MTPTDDLRPEDASLVDDRAAAAFAELRTAVDDVDVGAPTPVAAATSSRARRWLPAAAAIVVAVAAAIGATWLATGSGDRVDTGPADGGSPGYYVPTEWPAELDGPTRAAPFAGDESPPTWLLSRNGVPSVVLLLNPPAVPPPARTGPGFAVGGRPAEWYSPHSQTYLVVQLAEGRVLGLRSWTAQGAELEEVGAAVVVDGEGHLEEDSLPDGWTARPDTSGLLGVAFSDAVVARGTAVSREDPTGLSMLQLGLQQYRVADETGMIETLAALLGDRVVRVDVGGRTALRFGESSSLEGSLLTGARLVWSPEQDVLLVSGSVDVAEDVWMVTARSVEPIDATAWADLVAESDRAVADEAYASGELDGLRWLVTGTPGPTTLALQLTDAERRRLLAVVQAAPGLATVADVRAFDRAVAAVAGPAGLSEAVLTVRDRRVESAYVTHDDADSTVVFAVVPYDEDGLPPPSGVVRLTGRLPDGSGYDSRG